MHYLHHILYSIVLEGCIQASDVPVQENFFLLETYAQIAQLEQAPTRQVAIAG
jgi:hypothetical protein